jgi:hypothetical protein
MKTAISFFLLAFMVLLGVAKSDIVSAQGNGKLSNPGLHDRTFPMETKESYLYGISNNGRTIPIICDGVEVDRLNGTLDVFCRMFGHYDLLDPKIFYTQWMIHNYSGSLNSETGEVFEIQGVKKIDSIDKIYFWHLNIKGDKGSHYIIFASGTTNPFTITIEKAVCPSNASE